MADLSWTDAATPTCMFQLGMRICDHFALAMSELAHHDVKSQYERLDDLNTRMSLMAGGLSVDEYVEHVRKELVVYQGEPLSDAVWASLAGPYDYTARVQAINAIALDQVRKCVSKWGGPQAADRLKALAELPLQCGASDGGSIECAFDRDSLRINVGAGVTDSLLNECMIFEFTLFHEYLSHAFPDWDEDEPDVSEAWLFALELQWFKYEYTALDTDLLVKVWEPRLQGDRDPFRAAEWLLGRCDSRKCVATFVLNLVSNWESLGPEHGSEFLSLLVGAATKAGLKSGGRISDKQQHTLDLVNDLLCAPCGLQLPSWDLKAMHSKLKQEISKYGLKI
jgi:hypothetical protein